MDKQKKETKGYMQQIDKSYAHYQRIYLGFCKFEESAVDYFTDGEMSKRTLTHPEMGDSKQKVVDCVNEWKNPMREVYLFVKGEHMDIKAMLDAVGGRETVMRTQLNLETKRRDNQAELEKLSIGKTTLKSFFQTKAGKDKSMTDLEGAI